MKIYCYDKCSTCKKALEYLDGNGIKYETFDIKGNNPTAEQIKEWHKMSGLPLKKFFNTSGLVYKDLQLKDKLPTMSAAQQYELLGTNGMLVKRPLVICEGFVLTGFKEKEWAEKLRLEGDK